MTDRLILFLGLEGSIFEMTVLLLRLLHLEPSTESIHLTFYKEMPGRLTTELSSSLELLLNERLSRS